MRAIFFLIGVAIPIGSGVLAPAEAGRYQRAEHQYQNRKDSSKASQTEMLPPQSYVCPMAGDEDVIEDTPGRCRKCGMELKPIRLDTAWTCPVHAAVMRPGPGKCPIDARELVQVTVAVSWTCRGTDVDALAPATCADGSAMVKKFTPRPHGNHNPQHGGIFFMAPDNWHHLEGALPQAGVMRVFLYDDFTKPLPLDQAKLVQGHIVTKETPDPSTKAVKEVAFPLALTRDGRYLEAKIDRRAVPASMVAKVKFKTDGPEYR